jgi:PAS domain S-box-containing protein
MWKVLVVDDNASNRTVVRTLLEEEGYQAIEAADGAEGLRVAEKERPQLVISDILMPSMDGYEFVRQLRANPTLAQILVIFYTANYHRLEAKNLAEQCGVARVIIKPCSRRELLGAVADVLDGANGTVVPEIKEEFDRAHLQLLTDKLSNKADELSALNSRFAALTELNVQLASERDPSVLLERVCAGARSLLGAKYAYLAIADRLDSKAPKVWTSGLGLSSGPGQINRIDEGLPGEAYLKQCPVRASRSGKPSVNLGPGIPVANSAVAAPISSLTRTYGWLCLINKLGSDQFDTNDERMLSTLGAQVGRIYENGTLYLEVQQHAAQLLVEMEERSRASDKLRAFAQTQAALAASEKRLRVATEQMHIGIWEADPATGQCWCNDECYKMIGREPDGSLGTTAAWLALIHPDDRPQVGLALDHHVAGVVNDYRRHYRVLCQDGSYRWVLSQISAMERGSDGKAGHLTGIRFDITELKTMEQQLAAAQRLESIGQLAAGVAHEINTPIQYVNDSVYFAKEGVQELLSYLTQSTTVSSDATANADLAYLQENLPPALDRAIDGLARVTEIVASMKEFSHPDQQEKSPVDLNRAINSTLIVARSEYKYVATVETELGALPTVTCYGSQINQVVLNLVVNAAHAIGDRVKGTETKGLITVRTFLEGDNVVISVSDTGSGIPEAVRDRIFEPFFTTKEVGRGTGQGLTFVHNIVVKGHGGRLNFETTIGVGTTFFVRLPIEPAAVTDKERAA